MTLFGAGRARAAETEGDEMSNGMSGYAETYFDADVPPEDAAYQRGLATGLEAAAMVCDERAHLNNFQTAWGDEPMSWHELAVEDDACAAAIRALAQQPPPTGGQTAVHTRPRFCNECGLNWPDTVSICPFCGSSDTSVHADPPTGGHGAET